MRGVDSGVHHNWATNTVSHSWMTNVPPLAGIHLNMDMDMEESDTEDKRPPTAPTDFSE